MAKKPICPICKRKYVSLEGLYEHIEGKHADMLPKDMSGAQYYYFTRTGKAHGNCIICKKPTAWNPHTNKYSRLCGNPKCKQALRDQYKKNMMRKYGKITLLDDPEHQRKMLSHREISGQYTFANGSRAQYVGSYEKQFLEFLDKFFQWDPADILSPSPFTYGYEYENGEHFYIPDIYIPSLDLNIEVKDGGTNPNSHPKIQGVDKIKEENKDACMLTQPSSYIKIYNNDFGNFILFLLKRKQDYIEGKDVNEPIYLIEDVNRRVTLEAWTGDRRIPDPTMAARYYAAFDDKHPLNYNKTRKHLERELEKTNTLKDMDQLRAHIEFIRGDCERELKDDEGYRQYEAKKIIDWLDNTYMPQFEKKYDREVEKTQILRAVTEGASRPGPNDVIYNKDTGVPLTGKEDGFFFDHNGEAIRWNAIHWINNQPYREVVETLIFRDDKVYLYITDDDRIKVPGGSLERSESLVEQALAEIHEESGLEVTNLEGPHLTYIRKWGTGKDEWFKKPNPRNAPVQYAGKYIHLFSAIATGKKFKGKVDPYDIDEKMRKKGKFYSIDKVYDRLYPAHQQVVDIYRKKYRITAPAVKESLTNIISDATALLEKTDVVQNGKKRLIFLPLFSNKTPFANLIRRVTGQPYSHAGISLDSSMNNIWSFSNIPYVKNMMFNGFVRESIYAPQYVSNIFFDVFAMEIDEEAYHKLERRIEYMKKQGADKFRYNTAGLIEYYFHKTRAGLIPLEERTRYFCSEFTAFMLNEAKELPTENTLISPGDVAAIDGVFFVGRYTVKDFDPKELVSDIHHAMKKKKLVATFEAGIPSMEHLLKPIIDRLQAAWQEPFLVRYVGLLDWKALRDHYMKTFSKAGVEKYDHFNLIEMIVRAHAQEKGARGESRDYTEDFKQAMNQMRDFINRNGFHYIETKEREIYIDNNGKVERMTFRVDNGKLAFDYQV